MLYKPYIYCLAHWGWNQNRPKVIVNSLNLCPRPCNQQRLLHEYVKPIKTEGLWAAFPRRYNTYNTKSFISRPEKVMKISIVVINFLVFLSAFFYIFFTSSWVNHGYVWSKGLGFIFRSFFFFTSTFLVFTWTACLAHMSFYPPLWHMTFNNSCKFLLPRYSRWECSRG